MPAWTKMKWIPALLFSASSLTFLKATVVEGNGNNDISEKDQLIRRTENVNLRTMADEILPESPDSPNPATILGSVEIDLAKQSSETNSSEEDSDLSEIEDTDQSCKCGDVLCKDCSSQCNEPGIFWNSFFISVILAYLVLEFLSLRAIYSS